MNNMSIYKGEKLVGRIIKDENAYLGFVGFIRFQRQNINND